MLRNNELCNKYDLSAVRTIISGAAPLAAETATELQKQHPKWAIRQGYGKCTLTSRV
jgi:acyl-coenzyme A synthetase/AMP-(fatty) acid ligase